MRILVAIFICFSLPSFRALGGETVPAIQGVSAFSIRTSQPAVLADWYRKFGFNLNSAGNLFWGTLQTPSGDLAFAIHPSGANSSGAAAISIVLRVNDYQAYVSLLEARGLRPASSEADATGHFAHFKDPDQNQITIWGD